MNKFETIVGARQSNMNDKGNILYVDDEVQNLNSFKLVFREYYHIYTAKSAEDGLKILEQHPIQIVITDQLMPEVSGLKFLEIIKPIYPDLVTIILTAYSDLEVAFKAFNDLGVYQFLTKPWNHQQLKSIIDNALEKQKLTYDNRKLVQDLRDKIDELDTLVYRTYHDANGSICRLLGLTDVGLSDVSEEKSKSYFRLMQSEAYIMRRMLMNLIKLNEIGNYELFVEPIDFRELVQKAIDETGQQHPLSQFTIEIDIAENLDFYSDEELVYTILKHLIHNAFQYHHENPFVKIRINRNESNELFIEISDNGIGIAPDIKDKIFDKFYRGSQRSIGNGLGLYLVKLAVQNLRGKLCYENNSDNGVTFRVHL
jgi:two-component system, sensor histidine kinase and response regulator